MSHSTFIIFLTLIGFGLSDDYECIRDAKYKKYLLKDDVSGPYQLVIDHNTNTLFFSYAARVKSGEYFRSAYINMKTNEFGTISGIEEGFANAVDDKQHEIYLGGQNGLYKLDYKTKSATNLGVTSDNIWQMFYRDGLYFSTYPDEQAYLYKNGAVVRIPGVGNYKALIIGASQTGNVFFTNSTGLFMYIKTKGETKEIGDLSFNGISADVEGNLYGAAPDGIYYINESKQEIEKILSIENCYGLAVEANGDIIYALENRIMRLQRTAGDCVSAMQIVPFLQK